MKKLLLIVFGVPLLLVIFGAMFGDNEPKVDRERVADQQRQAAAEAKRRAAAALEACTSDRAGILAKHAELVAAGKRWEAARSISRCADHLKDAELLAMVKQDEIAAWTSDARSTNKSTTERLDAIDKLERHYPEAAKALQSDKRRLVALRERAEKQAERQRLAEAKKRGVTIGMTQQQVIESSWGRPESVNRTTTAHGVREQWVYGSGNYLYFEDGVLTAIQN
ncbi:hypothetical protein [Rubrivivax albus]|uniref:Uncharacterized protein n=1 Tax=Rubrivivax albus TaxID=2499835 RepID=A0A437JNJ5_9BURK|nr:hypothetical protein [Rubrivivax albus]RVT48395.1 hypothetical protein ENE75_22120 [Rubrivivax albus]